MLTRPGFLKYILKVIDYETFRGVGKNCTEVHTPQIEAASSSIHKIHTQVTFLYPHHPSTFISFTHSYPQHPRQLTPPRLLARAKLTPNIHMHLPLLRGRGIGIHTLLQIHAQLLPYRLQLLEILVILSSILYFRFDTYTPEPVGISTT